MKKRRKTQTRDVNSKAIFRDPILCAQFLRDNFDIPMLKEVSPEDIEDVSERYQSYLGIEFQADTVKKIWRKGKDETPFYIISLIVLVFVSKKSRAPKAEGIPYDKGQR